MRAPSAPMVAPTPRPALQIHSITGTTPAQHRHNTGTTPARGAGAARSRKGVARSRKGGARSRKGGARSRKGGARSRTGGARSRKGGARSRKGGVRSKIKYNKVEKSHYFYVDFIHYPRATAGLPTPGTLKWANLGDTILGLLILPPPHHFLTTPGHQFDPQLDIWLRGP